MKRKKGLTILAWICLVPIMLICVFGVGVFLFIEYAEYKCPDPEVYEMRISPDGNHIVYGYTRNCFILDDIVYHVSVVKKGEQVPHEQGNVFGASNGPATVQWEPSGKLTVEYNPNQKQWYEGKKEVNGVEIQFSQNISNHSENSKIITMDCIPEPNAQRYTAPNDTYLAYIFQRSCPSDDKFQSQFRYHLSIESTTNPNLDNLIHKEPIFHSSHPFQVRWQTPDTLLVEYDPKGTFSLEASFVKVAQDGVDEASWPTVNIIYREEK